MYLSTRSLTAFCDITQQTETKLFFPERCNHVRTSMDVGGLIRGITELPGKTLKVVGDGTLAVLQGFTEALYSTLRVVGIDLADESTSVPDTPAKKSVRVPSVDEEFEAADAKFDQHRFAKPLSRKEQLFQHALRKQALRGDVQGKRPPRYQPEARAKWDAWAQLEGDYSQQRAKQRYVVEVDRLVKSHGSRTAKR